MTLERRTTVNDLATHIRENNPRLIYNQELAKTLIRAVFSSVRELYVENGSVYLEGIGRLKWHISTCATGIKKRSSSKCVRVGFAAASTLRKDLKKKARAQGEGV